MTQLPKHWINAEQVDSLNFQPPVAAYLQVDEIKKSRAHQMFINRFWGEEKAPERCTKAGKNNERCN